jgi:hypothetical protein
MVDNSQVWFSEVAVVLFSTLCRSLYALALDVQVQAIMDWATFTSLSIAFAYMLCK